MYKLFKYCANEEDEFGFDDFALREKIDIMNFFKEYLYKKCSHLDSSYNKYSSEWNAMRDLYLTGIRSPNPPFATFIESLGKPLQNILRFAHLAKNTIYRLFDHYMSLARKLSKGPVVSNNFIQVAEKNINYLQGQIGVIKPDVKDMANRVEKLRSLDDWFNDAEFIVNEFEKAYSIMETIDREWNNV